MNSNIKAYFIAGTIVSLALYKYRLFFIGKNYKKQLLNAKLLSRFSTKYQPQNTPNLIGSIYPSNIYDLQKLFQMANQYRIPVINDMHYQQRLIPFQHIKLDLSQFNKVLNFNEEEARIKVNSGITIKDLIAYLRLKGYTIRHLEHLKESSLTLNDVLFSRYHSLHKGRLIDETIDEFTVLIPKGERILLFKPNNDFSFNHVDYSGMFLYSNNAIGVVLDVQLIIDKDISHISAYLKVNDLSHKTLQEALKEVYALYSANPLIEDIYVIPDKDASGLTSALYLKVHSEHLPFFKALLSQKAVKYSIASSQEVNQIQIEQNANTFSPALRKAKILLPQQNESKFIDKLLKLLNKAENQSVKPSIAFSPKYNQIDLSLSLYEGITLIEKEFLLMRDIYKLVSKTNGRIYLNSNVILNPNCDLTQEIGYNHYIINEDIKYYFDPYCILNPNLSLRKPMCLERLKRRSRVMNFFLTKMKI